MKPLRKQGAQARARLCLRVKQRTLTIHSPTVLPRTTRAREHPVTRDEQRDRIRAHRRTYCPARFGPPHLLRDLPIARASAKWDRQQRPPDRFLKVRACRIKVAPPPRRIEPLEGRQPLQKGLTEDAVRRNASPRGFLVVKNQIGQTRLIKTYPHPPQTGQEAAAHFTRSRVLD